VGETGPDGITLGGHDAIGEAYSAFQDALLTLKSRGVLLAIASKNEESVAMEALRAHPEMRVRPSDFAAYRINWSDKAANIVSIADELNLGLQSVVFIDDNPGERGRVREALPEVLTPDWPVNPMEYRDALTSLSCFDQAMVTLEDADRASMYSVEHSRQEARRTFTTVEQWLESLELQVEIQTLAAGNLLRAAQLLNKTNQMNLRTRRLAAHELEDWASHETRVTKVFRVRDRFGDSGLTGLLSVERSGSILEIVDFVLSCRVFGRRIEHLMLGEAAASARAWGCRTLQARYAPTEKNGPCLTFLRESGMRPCDDMVFDWPADTPYPVPQEITVLHIQQ
jgi:FkbH-like protein